ncbi:NAD-dependent epimerase/dehydratase family protein [Polymorphobacter fuscus]|uniref:NAD-dependent epimerase/dehydratase family protein n=1 Tax=Sandarakinorhabdus fusca TaxID=1439888 RepID=A0A7C9GPK7_9SPHN|nr:NAD-dependent epimerase/dehydratase family protein [Polymorphobacter fuscus]KAB7648244.1 NAD-dependent epimerase/dehydratase family protein [Polymorphobacter fuscus]MQT15751.1 NAD-dependent epimerase/dehydratase family protein [Polymorphobacter fuscus]NJC07978.1 UDP-glucuronate 4-epimerase [Polymorphobacter fuscus]
MKILVTGAAGFIGAHVVRALLARGETVIGIDNLNDYYPVILKQARLERLIGRHDDFRFVTADFADSAALHSAIAGESIDRIIHLGAQAGVRYSIDNPRAYAHSNLAGQLEILELARTLQVQHLVYASSSSVYGDAARLPLDAEDRADRPVSFYAATKKSNELMAESYAHLYRIPTTGLRFFTVYGPWGRPDMALWRFVERIFAQTPLPIYNNGAMKRDFTYIDDIVAGVLAALDRPPASDGAPKPGGSTSPHAVYNLGNDDPEELGRLVELIGDACGITPVLDYLPMQPGDVTATWADIGPARRDLGYDPATPLAVGVPAFVDWYRSYTGAISRR